MALIVNNGAASFKGDLEALFENLQDERSAVLEQVRSVQLASRVLLAAEARRLAGNGAADAARAAKFADAVAVAADRISALDAEVKIAAMRVPLSTASTTAPG